MSSNLVIVESPAKAKTIGKILGSGYNVLSSVGHIRDLPTRTLGVDVENNFKPKYVVSTGKAKVVEELRKAAKGADAIYLAPDPDREGEAIAWHLREVLESAAKGKPFYRISYNEITPRAVKKAFENPGELNMQRVDAQQGRRIIDRIVGYQVSPLLWRRIKRGLSAGRVQSVALRLVCEREQAIRSFVPEEYWIMGALLCKAGQRDESFEVKLSRIDGKKAEIGAEEAAQAVLADLEGRTLRVNSNSVRKLKRNPLPPFITSTLQQAASSVLGYSPSRTMSLSQKLYEGIELGQGGNAGLITYMRTDSPSVSQEARDAAKDFITENYGSEFYPEKPNFYRSRGGAQEAHEAIRPTDVSLTPESLAKRLPSQELRLYDLIWRRFVASQMAAAQMDQRILLIDSEPPPAQQHSYQFRATATEVTFPGFLRVMELDIRKDPQKNDSEEVEESDEVGKLPPLAEGEAVDKLEWRSERKETRPPARYSEAALVKALEAEGVGRPSTYAAILETLSQREYVAREKRQLVPTPLGFRVFELLVDKLSELFDIGFTAGMEERLDKIEDGEIQWQQLMSDFYKQFSKWLEEAREPSADPEKVRSVLEQLEKVSEWAPPVKHGRRTYDDAKFVESIRTQLEKDEHSISERQLDTIVKMALRYHEQLEGVRDLMLELGFEDLVTSDEVLPPRPETKEKFDLLRTLEISSEQASFVNSLEQQVSTGRRLSEAQVRALDRVVLSNARRIDNFEEIASKLAISIPEGALDPDNESPQLLELLSEITEWREPVKRGKRMFDDKDFMESVSKQFERKGALTVRQRGAMKKMILRYRKQITNAETRLPAAGIELPKTKKESLTSD